MSLLKKFKRWLPRQSRCINPNAIELGEGPRPPFDLLDRTFRLPEDEIDVNVIGYRYGTAILPIPYVLRCRIQKTGELVLIDPEYLRRIGTDVSPARIRKQASRRPYVPMREEVIRVIGWGKFGSQNQKTAEIVHLATCNDPDQGEGGAKS